MYGIALAILILSLFALVHTYVLYPYLVRLMARGKSLNASLYAPDDRDLPVVSVLMSVYNEEKVIGAKMESLLALKYPREKLFFYIGSDCSSDGTNAIVGAVKYPNLNFYPFEHRRGKPPVINELAAAACRRTPAGAGHVLLLTDANVLLEPETLYRLVRHFRNTAIGVVDAHMRSAGIREEGISRSEALYLSGEILLKNAEGRLWGKMIGPFGGCYALRSDLFEPVPPNSLVDDFYLVFRVLEKGYAAINDLDAVCHEGATHRVSDEFRRKKRIAAGSFQNLMRFRRWVLPPVTTLGFAFFSHKVLRWFGGFLILACWLSLAVLSTQNLIFNGLFWAFTAGILLVPVANWLFSRLNWHILPLRSLSYFLAMNLALVAGFFKWLRGIKGNTWQRTERY